MQRARCYLIGETAVVLELEPPVTLASQKRIWRLAQRLVDMPNVVEAIPGMNNITVILRNPESLALDAIALPVSVDKDFCARCPGNVHRVVCTSGVENDYLVSPGNRRQAIRKQVGGVFGDHDDRQAR